MTSSAKKEVDPRVMLGTFKSSYVEELKTKDPTMTTLFKDNRKETLQECILLLLGEALTAKEKFREASHHALEAKERFHEANDYALKAEAKLENSQERVAALEAGGFENSQERAQREIFEDSQMETPASAAKSAPLPLSAPPPAAAKPNAERICKTRWSGKLECSMDGWKFRHPDHCKDPAHTSRCTSASCKLWHNWPRLSKRQSQSGNAKRPPKGKQQPHRAQAKGSGNGGKNKSGGVPRDSTNALLRAQLQASQATLRAKDLEQKLHKQNRTSSRTFAAVAATKSVAASSQLTSQSTSTPTRAQLPDSLDFIKQMAALFAKFTSPQLV
jgi:hypothetical protein